MASIRDRLLRLDWDRLEQSFWDQGYAKTEPLLTTVECHSLIRLYGQEDKFRTRIDMARYRFGLGEYKYFADPLPPIVAELREQAYPWLATTANRWMDHVGSKERYPEELAPFLDLCHRKGQSRPTPLLLRYEAGGYNCLHQDLYGDVAFPLQLTCFLSQPGEDYEGGEFLLVEQRPRAQSIGHALRPQQGEVVIFPTRYRPAPGTRGFYRVNVKHGVSRVHSGQRYALGIIFHDAR
jgi:hypothetical protein